MEFNFKKLLSYSSFESKKARGNDPHGRSPFLTNLFIILRNIIKDCTLKNILKPVIFVKITLTRKKGSEYIYVKSKSSVNLKHQKR